MIYLVGLLGICLFLVGRWGCHRVSELVPATLPPEMREKNERVMRRVAWVLQIAGVVLVVFSVAGIAHLLFSS